MLKTPQEEEEAAPIMMPQPRRQINYWEIVEKGAKIAEQLAQAESQRGRCRCRFTKVANGGEVQCQNLTVQGAYACQRHKCHQCIHPVIEGANGERVCQKCPKPVSPYEFLMSALKYQEELIGPEGK
jgi:hypothetical protein